MNVRRRVGQMGGARVGTDVKTDSAPKIGTHADGNTAKPIRNAVAMQPKGGPSTYKEIKGSVCKY